MKNFLKKYLTEEQLNALEEAYKKEHPEAKELPVYIGKSRLDEVLAKQKAAETERDQYKSQLDSVQSQIDEAVKKANEESKKQLESALASQQHDFEVTEAIYKAKGKNVKAIKALMDSEKPYKDEIARLQKEESYLFTQNTDDIPDGTGKKDPGSNDNSKELENMRRAVGLTR